MNIKHDPIMNIKKAVAHYSEKDGVEVQYVCTTELDYDGPVYDIFYRATPHPTFGNRYFGLTYDSIRECMWIGNADRIENLDFGMIEHDLEWYYSQFRHDYISLGGRVIDGGRAYARGNGFEMFKVKDGEFVDGEADEESIIDVSD